MADDTGPMETCSVLEARFYEYGQQAKLTNIMELLRSKRQRQSSWADTLKHFKTPITDKRVVQDTLDKALIRRHLETLQKALKVSDVASLPDRLACVAHQFNLKFTATTTEIYLSHDMFHIQIMIDNGTVKDSVVCFNSEDSSCPELTKSLSECNMDELSAHIKGFLSISSLCSDKKQKSKFLSSLQSLETDLNQLSKFQRVICVVERHVYSIISSVPNYIHKSPLGIVLPRNGGIPMRMVYFVGPYDLLNEKTKSSSPMTVEAIVENKIGYSVTLEIESSSPCKLQSMPLMVVNQYDGKSQPNFSPMASFNSTVLPAVFVLRLEKPLPVSLTVLRKIKENTGLELVDSSDIQPMATLLLQQLSKSKCKRYYQGRGLTVVLPDQQHQYFIGNYNGQHQGVLVKRVPFTHPTSVPLILKLLREQVLFNTIMSSCIRHTASSASGEDIENSITFEVTPVSLQSITVSFEHPSEDTMATAELDLTDITAVKCRLSCGANESDICCEEYATRVLQRSLSLPVTMRAVLIKAKDILRAELKKCAQPATISPIPQLNTISKIGLERRQAFIASHEAIEPYGDSLPNSAMLNKGHQNAMGDFEELESRYMEVGAVMNPPNSFFPPKSSHRPPNPPVSNDKVSRNPMLASLLDSETANNTEAETNCVVSAPVSVGPSHAPMLSALLGNDSVSAASVTASVCPPTNSGLNTAKRRTRKRRSNSDRSPINSKRKPSEDDMKDLSSIDFDPGSVSPYDFGSCATNAQGSANTTPTLTTPTVNLGGDVNPFLQESHVNRLASTLDSIIKQESKPPPSLCHGLGDQSQTVDCDDINKRDRLSVSSLSDLVKTDDSRRDNVSGSMGGGGGGSSVNGSGANHRRPSSASSNQVSSAVDNLTLSPVVNDSLDGLDVFSSVPSISTANKGSLDVATPTSGSSLSKTLGNNKIARLKSQSHDPFSFTASLVRQTSGESADGLDNLDVGVVSRKGISTPLSGKLSLTVSTPTNSVNSNSAVIAKSKANNVQVKTEPGIRLKMEEGSVKVLPSSNTSLGVLRDRKKEKRESRSDEGDRSSPSVGESKPPITVKLNKSRIIKQSPVHKSPSISPDLLDLQWHDKSAKDSTARTPNSAHSNSLDIGLDAELSKNSTNSNASSSSSGSSVKTPSSPRILTGSLKRSDLKTETKMKGEKRKRSSKHSLVGLDEKKRRRAEEAVKKEQLKKQRIYDFDAEVNETENFKVEKGPSVKPNTIKITKISSSSRPVVPSLNKSPSRTSSVGSALPVKMLKHASADKEKSVPSPKLGRPSGQRNHSRSRSEPGGSNMASNKLRSLSVKIKPLDMVPGGTTVMVSTPTSSTTKTGPSPTTPGSSRGPPLPSSNQSVSSLSTQRSQSASTSNSNASNPAKTSNFPAKHRKGSLSEVIDKLTKQKGTKGFPEGKEGGKKSDLYDAIRLQLIKAGNKPSTPTNESGAGSPFKSSPGKKALTATSISSLKAIPKVPKASYNPPSSAPTKQNTTHSGNIAGRKSPSVSSGNNATVKNSGVPVSTAVSSASKTSNTGLSSVNKTSHSSPVKAQSSPLPVKSSNSTENHTAAERPKELSFSKSSSSTSNIQSPPKAENSSPSVPIRTIPLTKQSVHMTSKPPITTHSDLCKGDQIVKVVQSSPHNISNPPLRTNFSSAPAKPNQPVTFTESPASPTPENRGPNALPQQVKESSLPSVVNSDHAKLAGQEEALTPDRTPSRHFLDAVIKFNGSNGSAEGNGTDPAGTPLAGPAKNPDATTSDNMANKSNKTSYNMEPRPNTPKTHGSNATSSSHNSGHCKNLANEVSSDVSDSPTSLAALSSVDSAAPSLSPEHSLENHCTTPTRNTHTPHSLSCEAKSVSEPVEDSSLQNDMVDRVISKTKFSVTGVCGSEDKENKSSVGDDDVFKAPTPKTHFYSDLDMLEGHRSRSDSRMAVPVDKSRLKNILSPRSDISSPDDGLVIDELTSPVGTTDNILSPVSRARDRSQSPKSPANRFHSKQHSPCDIKSPVNYIPRSPSPRKQSRPPCLSPLATKAKHSANVDSPAARHSSSPVEIDDDLMETALGIK